MKREVPRSVATRAAAIATPAALTSSLPALSAAPSLVPNARSRSLPPPPLICAGESPPAIIASNCPINSSLSSLASLSSSSPHAPWMRANIAASPTTLLAPTRLTALPMFLHASFTSSWLASQSTSKTASASPRARLLRRHNAARVRSASRTAAISAVSGASSAAIRLLSSFPPIAWTAVAAAAAALAEGLFFLNRLLSFFSIVFSLATASREAAIIFSASAACRSTFFCSLSSFPRSSARLACINSASRNEFSRVVSVGPTSHAILSVRKSKTIQCRARSVLNRAGADIYSHDRGNVRHSLDSSAASITPIVGAPGSILSAATNPSEVTASAAVVEPRDVRSSRRAPPNASS